MSQTPVQVSHTPVSAAYHDGHDTVVCEALEYRLSVPSAASRRRFGVTAATTSL
ncbi:hypothetical protein [Nocardia terpenica]|uniref:hypothetical protein n=1 Tax=Nocardia terpenica TaxID=455432 RepID=UPI0012FD6E1A|nr:hypothetical protein [Nocardia terpenica]